MSAPTEKKKETATKKLALLATLRDLLSQAPSSPAAAQEALRACTSLRRKPPSLLITQQNIAEALSPLEIAKSLSLLSISKQSIDLSAALTALRTKGKIDDKSLIQVSRAVNSNLAKLVREPSKNAKPSNKIKESPSILFPENTINDAAAVILWLVTHLFGLPVKRQRSSVSLATKLIQSLDEIWRRSERVETAHIIVRFFQSIRRNVNKAIYAELNDNAQIDAFFQNAKMALFDWAKIALLDGRLKELQAAVGLVKDDRAKLLADLQQICRIHSSQIPDAVIEWVAQEVDADKPSEKPLIAADESQSSTLNYVAISLLDAWEAAGEGKRAARALTSIQNLARELFKVEFNYTPGEVVNYDERQHEITTAEGPAPTRVEIIRPGIRWSDGTRTRSLIRALVKAP